MYGHPWLKIHRLHALEKHNHAVLREEIADFQPDLIHVWNMGGVSKSLLLRLEGQKIPVVYDVSDHWIARSLKADVWLSWWNAPGSSLRGAVRSLLEATGMRSRLDPATPTRSWDTLAFPHIYFCSAFMRDHTAAKGWPVKHARVIHCGIDTASFAVKRSHSRFEKLLWVGRINDDKDPFTAVRALAEARKRGLDSLTLDLYGGGDPADLARLEAEIARLDLGAVVARRSVPAAEMRELYAQYDALLFTSNWGEPFALTPLEAGASGLPVISSLDGGQAELVRDGVNAIAAGAGDPLSYADGISLLAADATKRAAIASAAREEILRKFDLAEITTQIESLLVQTASSPR
ncbi:hypothetical protein llg_43030 [Luteolibacter sp. LG18]|nr:hypothetical protein llg_43030 [Luteolibacter sp. LG18]